MAFGRRKHDWDSTAAHHDVFDEVAEGAVVDDDVEAAEDYVDYPEDTATSLDQIEPFDGEVQGPFDIEDFDDPEQAVLARLDLGSVLIPMPPGGQLQVEFNQDGVPTAIWVVTPNGRFTIAAYAAPKSPGLWREVAAELAEALRSDNAVVSIEDGPWGREVVGTGAGAVRFIGVDGLRWMIRCVVNTVPQSMPALVAEARQALDDTVVRRGDTPLPVRTPLPVELPEELAAQLRAAALQQAQQQQTMQATQQAYMVQQQQMQEQQERLNAAGSAMQQLRSTTAGG
jgi:hypothetical protein